MLYLLLDKMSSTFTKKSKNFKRKSDNICKSDIFGNGTIGLLEVQPHKQKSTSIGAFYKMVRKLKRLSD